jgi:hypothetical protein
LTSDYLHSTNSKRIISIINGKQQATATATARSEELKREIDEKITFKLIN